MAEQRRSYRTGNEGSVPQREERPTPQKFPGSTGRGSYPKRGGGDNSQYINITGLFTSKSGKADTAFLNEEMCDKLQSLKPGDVIGVSTNKKTGRLALWAIPAEAE